MCPSFNLTPYYVSAYCYRLVINLSDSITERKHCVNDSTSKEAWNADKKNPQSLYQPDQTGSGS